jgi:hypothetical protein
MCDPKACLLLSVPSTLTCSMLYNASTRTEGTVNSTNTTFGSYEQFNTGGGAVVSGVNCMDDGSARFVDADLSSTAAPWLFVSSNCGTLSQFTGAGRETSALTATGVVMGGDVGLVMATMVVFYVFCFSFSWGPVGYVLVVFSFRQNCAVGRKQLASDQCARLVWHRINARVWCGIGSMRASGVASDQCARLVWQWSMCGFVNAYVRACVCACVRACVHECVDQYHASCTVHPAFCLPTAPCLLASFFVLCPTQPDLQVGLCV